MAHDLDNPSCEDIRPSRTVQDFNRRVERAALMGAGGEKIQTQPSNQNQCCGVARPNPRQLIEQRIEYHNRMANGLCALLRAMPQEMAYPADDALASLIIGSRPSW